MGIRNLYKVFNETRKAAREQATLAVVGDSPRAGVIAGLLGAQKGTGGAEVILAVSGYPLTLPGTAVEGPGEVPLPSTGGAALLGKRALRGVRALEETYGTPLAKGYPPFRR